MDLTVKTMIASLDWPKFDGFIWTTPFDILFLVYVICLVCDLVGIILDM